MCLNAVGRRYHETDQLLLDGGHLVGGKLVCAVFVDIVEPDEVLEAEGRSEPGLLREVVGGDDLEEG